ncbi:hypothetical protein BBK36DRAFT_1135434, partial [Trichoderma citrinoviride]
MALLSPTFVIGVLVLLYLSSFVLFAVLRIVTGVSIQRIGYFSLRRIAYTPRDGIRIEVRGLGLNIHRPTFAQPTWLSIVLSDLTVTADFKKLDERKTARNESPRNAHRKTESAEDDEVDPLLGVPPPAQAIARSEAETWARLHKLKEKVKKLHHNVKWLRMVDVVVTNSVIDVVDVGSLQVGSLTLAVDTRHKMADRARFFFHRPDHAKENAEAEWILTIRSVFLAVDGNESLQILDHALLNVHGFLYPTQEGLRDATVALKLGRVQIPYDELHHCATKFKLSRKKLQVANVEDPVDIFVSKVQDEPLGDANEHLMKTVSDSKQFFSSILRGIKEVQFAVSFVGLVKKVESVNPAAKPVHLTASMKEVGVDLHRLDPKSPAHRMYFPSTDIAHEALVAALSISVGMDDGHGKPQRIVYIPMATTTIRTTLPSKTIQLSGVDSFEEKNANILFANSVVTSPSIDLDPRHLPLLIAMMRSRPKPPKTEQRKKQKYLLSQLLPKASIKFTMHEPVLRIKLNPLGKTEDPDDYGLIISSISSVSLDAESSHSPLEDLHYSLDGAMRLQSHHLYYQAVSGERFDLITTESFDLKVHLAANPEVSVDATSNVQSFSVSMVRPEITDGVRQIVRQLRTDVEPTKRATPKSRRHPNFLRALPEWLFRYQVTANDVNIEIAGVDEEISDDSKGISLHIDGLSAEYRAQRLDGLERRMLRRRTHSRSLTQSDSDFASSSPTRARKPPRTIGDGRRLVFNAKGIEAQIIETADQLELEPFINVPRLEFSLSASSDNHGPVFHIQFSIRSIMVQYSLYRHYAVGVAMKTLRKAFMKTTGDAPRASQQDLPKSDLLVPPTTSDSIIVDVKVALVQIKAEMPHDPMIMLHIYSLDAGRQRWLYSGRLDLRESKHKSAQGTTTEEKLVDVSAEAIRIGIPHEVIQLQHRFKTGTNEYILEKKPEGPKTVPKMEDGRMEQVQRLTRDEAFRLKLNRTRSRSAYSHGRGREVSAEEARLHLDMFNAQAWKKRIDRAYQVSSDGVKDDIEETENILEVPPRPALMATYISNLHISVDKPTLLVPMHISVDMGEARLQAEFRGLESTDPSASKEGSFAIEVRRTLGPVKSFSDPAIQDMMMVVESFTKPQIDPSERVEDGDMHFAMKGTRDPYQVTGHGAGFLMCWRNDIRWNINAEDNPKKFMTVDSGEYAARLRDDDSSRLANDHMRCGPAQVQRSFDFKPHYEVVLKNPLFAKPDENGLPYDAMRGFRTPADREWMSQSLEPSRSYNTIHLTPRFFTHFFAWWGLFSGPMSLPIRQGSLFPGREKNSKKFGRHLATVNHIYKHKDAEDYSENAVFMLDLHQRREEFNTIAKTKNSPTHLDLACADLRAAIRKASISHLTLDQDDKPDVWIDMDDFVELDWILPTEAHPETKILPLAYVPRLTYFRQTDIGGIIAGDPTRTSPEENDPKSVQAQLIKERLEQLDEQIRAHIRHVGEAELKVIRTDSKDQEMLEDFDILRQHSNVLLPTNGQPEHMDMPSIPSNAEFESEYENRFVIHNMHQRQPASDAAKDLEDRIKGILGDGRKRSSTGFTINSNGSGISDEYNPQCSYHVRLIAPQIQLQMVEVMDKSRIADNVSGLFFVTHQKCKYGTPTGSSWPPWVPMEVMFDFRTDPFGFKRVVQKTSAMLRYDKYNTLRLKSNDEVNGERVDNLWVEFPQARALCNSSQYYAIEPLEKTRNERLEKIILGSDFSDLSGIPEMVMKLQERIRQMEEIKSHFQTYSLFLDKKGSQRRFEKNTQSNALLKWSISVRDIPLVELQLKDLEYDRTDNADGSHMNLVRVGKLLGLNLLPDATPSTRYGDDSDMIRVYWYMLEAIAGIPVMEQFEIELFPIKIQLEREAEEEAKTNPSIVVRRDSSTEADEEGNESQSPKSTISGRGTPGTPGLESSSFSTRPGSLELHERTSKRTLGVNNGEGGGGGGHFRLFPSVESLRPMTATPRPGVIDSRDSDSKKASRFGLRSRHNTEDKQMSDDLTKMIERANNYITYKGKDQRNFEDVHNFNKTALISHTGAIIGNKLRELASSSALISPMASSLSQNYAPSIHDSDDSASISIRSGIPAPRSASRSSGSTHNLPQMPNLAVELLRPSSSQGLGSHRSGLMRTLSGGSDSRPSTSAGHLDTTDRKRNGAANGGSSSSSGGFGLRDKLSALTQRMRDRSDIVVPVQANEPEPMNDEEAAASPTTTVDMSEERSLRAKRMS